MATLIAYPTQVRLDATALVVFNGPANRTVKWGLTGNGVVTVISEQSDEQGKAYALYDPTGAAEGETVTMRISYGA